MSIKDRLENLRAYSRYAIIRQFFRIMGVKPIHIILPTVLAFISAAFNFINLGLIVLLVKGAVGNSFDFIQKTARLKYIVMLFPRIFSGTHIHNNNAFLFLIGLIFLCGVLKTVTHYANTVLVAYWHGRFRCSIYEFVFERFLTFGKLFFDKTNYGYLIMVMGYSEFVINMLGIFEGAINQFFTLIAYFAVMLMISWKLAICTIFIFPLLHYSLKLIVIRLNKIATLTNVSSIELSKNVFNILSCIPLVKVYSKEEETKADFIRINEKLRRLYMAKTSVQGLIDPIQEIIVTSALLIMGSAVVLVFAKGNPAEMSVFVVFFLAAKRALPLFNIFNNIKAGLAQAKPPLKELSKVFDDRGKCFVIEGPKIFEGLQKAIEFKCLNFAYIKDRLVLKDLSLYIEKGKITALVGPSGAGKTTIISLIIRFYDCPPDSILIDGYDIRDYTLKSLRKHMALVSQEALLLNDTLRNNMIFGLDRKIPDKELIEILKKARLYDFVTQTPNGFHTVVGDRGVKLSGGEKQRVAIARALLKKSEILILDEATSSLDTKTEQLIQAAIDEAVIDRTAIVIAHRLSTIKHADKIIVIEDGCVVEQGTLNELLDKKGKFYEYWEAQKFY